jgi:hypothetical protein
VLTRLDSAGRLVSCTGDVLADLGGGGLLGVGGDCKCVSVMLWWMAGLHVLTLLRRLLAETLAEVVRHVDGWLVG